MSAARSLQPSSRFMAHLAVSLAGAALVAMVGCAMDPEEPVPRSNYGVVEGYLLECGQPVDAVLQFSPDDPTDVDARVLAKPDSTGWYRVELPLGRYDVRVQRGASLPSDTYTNSDADTVLVGRAVRRRDFPRGRVQAQIRLPDRYDGRPLDLRLNRTGASASMNETASDGVVSFDLRLVPPGRYVARLGFDGDDATVFLPGTYLVAGADSLQVGAAPVHYEADLNGRYARVEGRVTGSWQQSTQPMIVYAMSPSGSTRSAAICAADGAFALDLIAPDLVRLVADCNGMPQWFGGTTSGTATLHALEAGQVISGLELREGGLRLRFAIPDLTSEGGATFVLAYPDGRRYTYSPGYRNPVELSNLPAGDYRVRVVGGCAREPWLPQWYDGVEAEGEARALTVVEGSFTEATIALRRGGVLRGRFAGEPQYLDDGRNIYLFDPAGAPLCDYGTWSEAGVFQWRGLNDGSYLLGLRFSGATWWYPGTWELDQATTLVVADGAVVEGLVWQLPESSVVIRK